MRPLANGLSTFANEATGRGGLARPPRPGGGHHGRGGPPRAGVGAWMGKDQAGGARRGKEPVV